MIWNTRQFPYFCNRMPDDGCLQAKQSYGLEPFPVRLNGKEHRAYPSR